MQKNCGRPAWALQSVNPILTTRHWQYKEPPAQPSPHLRLDSLKIAIAEDDLEIQKNMSTTTCTMTFTLQQRFWWPCLGSAPSSVFPACVWAGLLTMRDLATSISSSLSFGIATSVCRVALLTTVCLHSTWKWFCHSVSASASPWLIKSLSFPTPTEVSEPAAFAQADRMSPMLSRKPVTWNGCIVTMSRMSSCSGIDIGSDGAFW